MMKAIDKINKLIEELESEDREALETFKKNFEAFEMTCEVCKKFLDRKQNTNTQGKRDEINE